MFMFGQGRPHIDRWLSSRRRRLRLGAILTPLLLILCAQAAAAADVDLRIRIAWGGGEARPWQGTIRVSEGTVDDVTPLAFEADAPGSMLMTDPATVRIYPRTPRSYDGCDLRVQAPAGAKLVVQLAAGEVATAPVEIPLARLLRGLFQANPDDRNNRLIAERA